ncbi:hypothetical protein LY76DRAFT_596256 [Colletotrichum caudatum]|nr:hypothetical protein LY76DRAFT_596256 [Colletotrichum caudatum]
MFGWMGFDRLKPSSAQAPGSLGMLYLAVARTVGKEKLICQVGWTRLEVDGKHAQNARRTLGWVCGGPVEGRQPMNATTTRLNRRLICVFPAFVEAMSEALRDGICKATPNRPSGPLRPEHVE